MPTQGLILAAGRGSRLGSRTKEMPKPLLQVGPKRLVEHQLEMLSAAGIGPVGMVLGYQADEIVDIVGSQAEYIYNHKWATTNSLYSFLQAHAWVDGDLVLMNGDLVFHPRILDHVLAAGGDAFAYDSLSGDGREHMKVRLEDGHLREMSKTLPEADNHGENVGILFFQAKTARRLFEIARDLVDAGHTTDWVGTAVQRLASELPIKAVDIAGLKWAEIDFEFDLVRARKEVWPAIRKPGQTRRQFMATVAIVALIAIVALSGLFSSLFRAPAAAGPDWDTLNLAGVRAVMAYNGLENQRWFRLGPTDTAVVSITGPDTLRLESRIIPIDSTSREASYLLRVGLDGEAHDWMRAVGRASQTVWADGMPVGKRVRASVFVPDGDHTITVSVDPSRSVTCLIRIRQIDPSMEDGI